MWLIILYRTAAPDVCKEIERKENTVEREQTKRWCTVWSKLEKAKITSLQVH